MLGIHCPECKVPLFQDPKTGTVSCPICGTEFEVVEEGKAKTRKVGEKVKKRRKRTGRETKKETIQEEKEPDKVRRKQKREKEKKKQKREPKLSGSEDVREVALQVVIARLKQAAEAKDPEHALRELEVAEKALEILKKL